MERIGAYLCMTKLELASWAQKHDWLLLIEKHSGEDIHRHYLTPSGLELRWQIINDDTVFFEGKD